MLQPAIQSERMARGWEAFPASLRKWPGLGGQAKAAALFLYHLAGYKDNLVTITTAKLAEELGCSARAADRALELLGKEGLGEVARKDGRGHIDWHVLDPDQVSRGRIIRPESERQGVLFEEPEEPDEGGGHDASMSAVTVPYPPAVTVPKPPTVNPDSNRPDDLQTKVAQVVAKLPEPEKLVKGSAVTVPKPPTPSSGSARARASMTNDNEKSNSTLPMSQCLTRFNASNVNEAPGPQLIGSAVAKAISQFSEATTTVAQKRALRQRIRDVVRDPGMGPHVDGKAADMVVLYEVPLHEIDRILCDLEAMRAAGTLRSAGGFFHAKARELAGKYDLERLWPQGRKA